MLDTEDEPIIYHTLGGYARDSGLEPMIYRTLGEHANYYTTDTDNIDTTASGGVNCQSSVD